MESQQRNGEETRDRPLVRMWLKLTLVVLFFLVLLGGATRLTDSGLSITEWKPIHGIIPPTDSNEWRAEFLKYQKIPEYEQLKKGMSLEEFKWIFWWEWSHRLLARFAGILIGLPLAIFWFRGRIDARLKKLLATIFALCAIQGAVGWWMVVSGLWEGNDVSHNRLAVHLFLACIIISAVTLASLEVDSKTLPAGPTWMRRLSWVILILVFFQIYLGAQVAGTHAGQFFNTWPLMNGEFIPGGLFALRLWKNAFDNPIAIQFLHRLGAYLLFLITLGNFFYAVRKNLPWCFAWRALALFGLVSVQAILGIYVLLFKVPFSGALIHQGMGVLLLIFAVTYWRALRTGKLTT